MSAGEAERVRVLITRVGGVEVPLPRYQTEGAVGMDLCAAVAEPVALAPGERRSRGATRGRCGRARGSGCGMG